MTLIFSLTFGAGGKDFETGEVIDGWGYYETIAGGSGAGDGWHGTSGVHCHMTNTVSEIIDDVCMRLLVADCVLLAHH